MKCFELTRFFLLLLLTACLFTLPSSGLAATPIDLPPSAQAAVSATLGKDHPAYHAKQQGAGFTFGNPRHAFTVTLTGDGLTLEQSGNTVTLQLDGIGYGSPSQRVRKTVPVASANRVEYRRGQLVEWYVNGPLGLEQGVTVSAPPGPRTGGHLTLAFAIGGAFTPRVEATKTAVTFLSRTGEPRLRYTGLTVTDATGAALPAWLKGDGQRLLIQVDDAGARYPLIIDPFFQTELITNDGTRFNSFGPAIAISGDSNTVVVGAQNAFVGDLNFGAAYIFTQAGGGWTQQAKLTASDGANGGGFGFAVAISGDGNTVVVGVPGAPNGANSQQGAAYVFVKPVAGWVDMTDTAKLTASDGAPFDLLGAAVAVSGDTVVATAPGAVIGTNNDQGAAYVYVKPPSGWVNTTETTKLIASDGAADDGLGRYVGISGDTVVVGAERADIRFADDDQGAAYIFTGTGSAWTQQAKLTASDGAFNDVFGASVAISADTVVVGAVTANVGANAHQGAAYVFTRAGSFWTQQAKLTASDGAAFESFGHSVGISGDSNTVVVGAPRADIVLKNQINSDQGAAYAFIKPPGGWVNMTESAKLVALNGTGGAQFGSAVAASSATLGVVARTAGAAYVFTASAGATGLDLSGSWLSLTQECKGAGATLECRLKGDVEVRNQGTQKTPTTSSLRFYLSTDRTFDPGDTLLQQATVGTIDPGRAQRVTLSTTLPRGQSASGRFVIAVIDATNIIVETNEMNNVIVAGPLR